MQSLRADGEDAVIVRRQSLARLHALRNRPSVCRPSDPRQPPLNDAEVQQRVCLFEQRAAAGLSLFDPEDQR